MNTKISILIPLILLVLIVTAILYGTYTLHVFENIPVYSVSPSPSSSQGAWKVYTDKEFGFEIQYPADFALSFQEQGVRFIVPVKTYFRTVLANEARIDIYKPANVCPASQGDTTVSAGSIQAGTITFAKSTWSGVGAGQLYQGADYQVKNNNLCYIISLYAHNTNGAGFYYTDPQQISATDAMQAEDMEKLFRLVDNMVRTFRF